MTMRRVRRALLGADAPDVAPLLLNKLLVHGECVGRIVEVEAYREDDPASHTFAGPTPRNRVMFGPAGHLYVYFTYGMHWCANAVCEPEGVGTAVLLRALAPLGGVEAMRGRRAKARRDTDLCSGPAKLCQALAIDGSLDGADLIAGPPRILDDGTGPPASVVQTTRVGLTKAVDEPWRWYVADEPNVSRPR